MSSALVRAARLEDVAAVADSELDSFPGDAWTAAYVEAVVLGQLPTIRLLVLEYDGTIAGHAIISVLFEDAELQRIAVSPQYRRLGLGRELLLAVVAMSKAEGAERILLEVREENHGAIELYLAEGFIEIDRRERYYHDGATGVVFERTLDGATMAP